MIFQETSGTSTWATGDLLSAPSRIALLADGDAIVYDSNRLIRIDSVVNAIVAACDRTSSRGLSVYHLVDSHLPSQRAYLKALRSAGVIRAYIPLPWRWYGVLVQALRLTLEILGFRSRLPDAFYANSVAARCKPFAFSNSKGRHSLEWTPRQVRL